ncbi:MAG: hypothetical protein HOU01_05835 [Streptomycetaceae bacterium]|jgi:hypothetical protein|nr:hypothetical protein [Streptomycetaceae bacterium]
MTSPWQFDRTSDAVPSPEQHPGGFAVPVRRLDLSWPAVRGDVVAGVIVLLVCAVVGVAAGAIWHGLAPDLPRVVVGHQAYSTAKTPTEGDIARDGWFAVVGVVAGLLLAGLGFWKGRKYGIGVAVGLGLGGLLGSYVAYKVGAALGPDHFWQAVDKAHPNAAPTEQIAFDEPLRIQAMGVLYLWPMASMIVWAILMAGFGPRDPAPKLLAWPGAGEGGPHGATPAAGESDTSSADDASPKGTGA